MRCFHLFLLVFSALRLHLASSSDGLAENLPLIRYLAMEAALGHGNGSAPATDNHGRRRAMDRNETPRGRHDPHSVRFDTDLQTGVYEAQRKRPIQQLFYNIYIQDSPSIRVNNFIHAAMRKESTQSPLRSNDGTETPAIEKRPTVTTRTTEMMSLECPNGEKCGRVLLEADGESMTILDANSELFKNATTETPVSNKPIKFKIIDVSPLFQGQREDEHGSGDVPVGNIWRAFRPNSPGDTERGITRHYKLRYPAGIGNRNVMQMPHSETQPQSTHFNPNPLDFLKKKEYPAYGRHSYHEIMRKLFEMRKDSRKESVERQSDEYKMADSEKAKDILTDEKREG